MPDAATALGLAELWGHVPYSSASTAPGRGLKLDYCVTSLHAALSHCPVIWQEHHPKNALLHTYPETAIPFAHVCICDLLFK